MSLSKDQKRELERLRHYFKKIEKLALANNIDLDVFMLEYGVLGYSDHVTERVSFNEKATNRKNVFEQPEKDKIRSDTKGL